MERNITYIALFAALIAALGLLPGFNLASGIPITAQSLGIMLCGTILGAKRGALAVLLFLALVAIGLPLLSQGRGGYAHFFLKGGGFLFGFPVAAFCTGLIVEHWTKGSLSIIAGIAAFIGGVVVLYAIAIPFFMVVTGIDFITSLVAMSLYIPGDIIKAIIAGLITGALFKTRPAAVLSRA